MLFFSPAALGDLYQLFGVMSYSSLEQITTSYEQTKERIHPDFHSNSEESRERFEELEEAYAVLSDPDRRSQYNQSLKKTQTDEAPDFYKYLGVLSNSSPKQITKAYHQRRTRFHPDRHDNNKESNERSKKLREAFETLEDPIKRFRHDAKLKKDYVIPHLKRDKETGEGNLNKEDFISSEAIQASIFESDATAQFKPKSDSGEWARDEFETALWNEQVFQLAKLLEQEGGEGNINEAVSWYRKLAQEDHLDAAWRLAFLLENINIEEALYRYKQVQLLDSDGDLARSSVFRQAQLYQAGVYEKEKELLSPDLKKASLLYEEAFRLGVPSKKIVREYDKHQDFLKALEWRQREENNNPSQQLQDNSSQQLQESIRGGLMKMRFMTGRPLSYGTV